MMSNLPGVATTGACLSSETAPVVYYTSKQVLRLVPVSARQLQWWDEQGVVKPRQEGHRRLYTFEDLFRVALISELRARHFTLGQVRAILRSLKAQRFKVPADNCRWLLANEERVLLLGQPADVMAFLEQNRPTFALVPLDSIMHRLTQAMVRMRFPEQKRKPVQRQTFEQWRQSRMPAPNELRA